ncbi:peptidylprolyl isomerase [Actinophytocola oryzae]|uniref:Peptidyl-prolyl cis-trans isomerase B (Cyclophilin B) n=1 Tax=Actinophytocola oryzae TaxID=502181 RepID=A0A4R7VIA8_9PSEU|nr:peptidylprolyl isomerase [Actinophytocola oryzae]TDV48925.1 peptidyl-prolyl cis-trans isomerase B (cyclophilin B) [Actinophytocola oryzae]
MPSNEQRRQAAKRKLERQLARRVERAKRRRNWGVGITVIVVIAAVGLVYWLVNLGPGDSEASTGPDESTTANTTKGACAYTENPQEKPPKDPGLPDDPQETPKDGVTKVTLKTNQGDIPLTLDRSAAPCTVQSMMHLVEKKYFDGTTCHRLTASEGLKVLQCGDPLGTGAGGPGYSIPDELQAAQELPQGPAGGDGSPTVTYPRGAVAMANAGPSTGGSQFFLVYGNSTLPPNYTLFGTVGDAGLATLDKIAAGGITAGQNGPEDGAPVNPVQITSAVEQ